MNNFTILHLSDLHIWSDIDSLSSVHKYLLEDIKEKITNSRHIILVVTGDLFHKANFNQKTLILEFFQKLKVVLDNKIEDVFIVPGNHDKNTKISYLKYKNQYVLNHTNDISKEWKKEEWDTYDSSFLEFKDLKQEILKIFGIKKEIKSTYGVILKKIDNINIAFILLNTAWSCEKESRKNALRIGEFQINELKKEYQDIEENINMTIVLAHHPVEFFTANDQELLKNEILSSDGLNADIYICGHIHDTDVTNWYNKNKSLLTLVSGIGWPDTNDNNFKHTYSKYIFNLDINSIDVFVRATEKRRKFKTDFSIYTDKEIKEDKITLPINIIDNQSYFSINTHNGTNNKSYYFNNEIIAKIKKVNNQLLEFEWKMRRELYNNFDRLAYTITNQKSQKEKLREILYSNSLFKNENANFLKKINENKDDIYFNFNTYLKTICNILITVIDNGKLEENKNEIRIHFRGLSINEIESDTDSKINYKKICALFPRHKFTSLDCFDKALSDFGWEDLIKASYESNCSLVYSCNKDICKRKLDDKWNNFITIIPRFEGNEKTIKKTTIPYITFGITVADEKYDDYLYLLDFFEFDKILSKIVYAYIRRFQFDMEGYLRFNEEENLYKKEENDNE